MVFKEALEKYNTIKEEIADLNDAIQLIVATSVKNNSKDIAINVLKIEKEKKEKELIQFENYYVNDCIAKSSC